MKKTRSSDQVPNSDLRSVQDAFWNALTKPDPSAALSFLSSTNVTSNFGTKEKFDLYQYAYRARIAESIEEDFPYLKEATGAEQFEGWLDGFFAAGGSSQFSLVDASWDFYEFLKKNCRLNDSALFYLELDFRALTLFYENVSEITPLAITGSNSQSVALTEKKWVLSAKSCLMTLPTAEKYFLLAKDADGFAQTTELTKIEYYFLKYFSEQALTLEECAELILDDEDFKNSMNDWIENVSSWFANWTQEQILVSPQNQN